MKFWQLSRRNWAPSKRLATGVRLTFAKYINGANLERPIWGHFPSRHEADFFLYIFEYLATTLSPNQTNVQFMNDISSKCFPKLTNMYFKSIQQSFPEFHILHQAQANWSKIYLHNRYYIFFDFDTSIFRRTPNAFACSIIIWAECEQYGCSWQMQKVKLIIIYVYSQYRKMVDGYKF